MTHPAIPSNIKTSCAGFQHISGHSLFSFCYGLFLAMWLGLITSNHMAGIGKINLNSTISACVLTIFMGVLATHHDKIILPKPLIWAMCSYILFLCYLTLGYFFFPNVHYLAQLQPFITLPFITLIIFISCTLLNIKYVVYGGYLLYLLGGAIYTMTSPDTELRSFGLTLNPNSTAITLVMGALLSCFLCSETKDKKLSSMLMTGIGFMLYAIFLTGSRTGFLCMALITLYLLLFRGTPRKVAFLILLAGVMSSPFVMDSYQGRRLQSIISVYKGGETWFPGQKSASLRMETDIIAYQTFRDHPWTGTGLGSRKDFNPIYADSSFKIASEDVKPSTHNSYLLLLSETGIIGTGLFFLFLCGIGRLTFIKDNNRLISSQTVWLSACFLALLISGVTWHVFLKRIFWIWVGFTVVEYFDHRKERT